MYECKKQERNHPEWAEYLEAELARQAIEWFEKVAEHGDFDSYLVASAQSRLGQIYSTDYWLYESNRKTAAYKDDRKAAEWLEKAADGGDDDAQCEIGRMYALGIGVAKDEREAKEYFQKVTDQKGRCAADMGKGIPGYISGKSIWGSD